METFEEPEGAEEMEKESSALSVIYFLLSSFIFLLHSYSSASLASSSPPFLSLPFLSSLFFLILTQKDQT